MADEDLLVTNDFGPAKYMKTFIDKKKDLENTISKPSLFLDKTHSEENSSLPSNSIGYDQFTELSETNKKKKISLNDDVKIHFYKNSDFFYVITNNTYIDNHNNHKEMILLNLDDNIEKLGIDKSRLEFNDITGKYILEITGLIFNSITDTESPFYLNPLSNDFNTRFFLTEIVNNFCLIL